MPEGPHPDSQTPPVPLPRESGSGEREPPKVRAHEARPDTRSAAGSGSRDSLAATPPAWQHVASVGRPQTNMPAGASLHGGPGRTTARTHNMVASAHDHRPTAPASLAISGEHNPAIPGKRRSAEAGRAGGRGSVHPPRPPAVVHLPPPGPRRGHLHRAANGRPRERGNDGSLRQARRGGEEEGGGVAGCAVCEKVGAVGGSIGSARRHIRDSDLRSVR